MKNQLQKIFAGGLLLFVVLGCNLINQVKKEIEKSQAPKIINSTDNSCQLTVPNSWQIRTDLHEYANLQAGNPFAEQYAIVISESKADFTEEISLKDYTDLIIQATKENIQDIVFSEIKPLTINGYQANQFEGNGSVEKIKIRWIFTIFDAPKNFHQIVVWTTPSRFDENRSVLLDVVNSFKETGGSGAPAPPVKSKHNSK